MSAWNTNRYWDIQHTELAATVGYRHAGLGGRIIAATPSLILGRMCLSNTTIRGTAPSICVKEEGRGDVRISTSWLPRLSLAQNRSPAPASDTWTAIRETTMRRTSHGVPTKTTRTTKSSTERTQAASQMQHLHQSKFVSSAPAQTTENVTQISPESLESADQPLLASQTAQSGKKFRVLVGCEFSGIVRQAFRHRGHDAWSCDLLPAEDQSEFHYQCDVLTILDEGWDIAIFHPPCTHLAVSGARWFKDKQQEQADALEFVRLLMDAPIRRIAIENPISVISSRIRKPDQIIQPWQFGHGETKATCLWLTGLPPLMPTHIVTGRDARVHKMPPGSNRWRERSRTFAGIAAAMAAQWGIS